MRNKNLFYIVSLILLVASCKSSKEVVPITLQQKDKNERLDLIINQSYQYETFASQLKFTVKTSKNASEVTVDGTLKILKDKAIQLSLKMPILGTEVFRITLTPDQLIVIDRINKQYLKETITGLQKETPISFDFYSLQALISNQLFVAGKAQIIPNDYTFFTLQEDQYQFHLENKDDYDVKYSFTSDYTNRILRTEIYKDKEEAYMQWNYENFGLTDSKSLFPLLMKMELQLPDDRIGMNLLFNKVEINNLFELDTNFPSKYKQMRLQDILKMIRNL